MTEDVPLRLRIGGRGAVSWWTFGVLCALAIGGAVQRGVRADGPGGLQDARALVLVTLAACAAVGSVLGIAAVTVLRRRRQRAVAWWVVLAVGSAAGAAQALVVTGLSLVLDAPTWGPLGTMLVRDALVAGVAAVIVAAVLAEAEHHRARRDAMLEQLMDIRGQDAARAALSEEMRQAMLLEVMDATEGIRQRLGDAPTTDAGRRDFARGLMNAVDRDLRPLSRRLQQAQAPPGPHARAGGTTRWPHWRELTVQPIATATALMVLGFLFLLPATRAGEAAARTVSIAVLVAGALGIVAWAARRWPHVARWQMPCGVVAAVLAGLANYAVWRFAVGAPVPEGVLAGMLVGVPLCVLLASGLVWARQVWRGRLTVLQLDVDEAQLDAMAANREFVRVSRELAQYVHGTLQSHLLATAFAVEDAGRAGDAAAVGDAIESARQVFAAPPQAPSPPASLEAALAEQAGVWDGFVRMDVRIDPDAAGVAPQAAARIARVVEEAVGNARKHGGARHVEVAVLMPSPGMARVTVRDDGGGPMPGARGLGSSLLDEAAPAGWTLEAAPGGGSVLTALVPAGS